MAGLVGKGQRSYRKASVGDSNLPALGFRRFLFAFQNGATPVAAGTAITFASVIGNVPSEMTGNGFSQPTLAEVRNAEFGSFRDNVVVTSNLNGVLQDYITYSITDDQITFLSSYSVDASEIITISRGQEPVTGNRIVNAKPLRQSGDVDFSGIGSAVVDFSVPEGFRIAPSVVTGGVDSRQIGYVQVFVDGVLQFRNAGNGDEDSTAAAMQTGNYREIFVDTAGAVTAVTGGVANTIRFNMGQPFSSTEGVLVISTNLIVDDPNASSSIDVRVTTNSTNIASNTAQLVFASRKEIFNLNVTGDFSSLATVAIGATATAADNILSLAMDRASEAYTLNSFVVTLTNEFNVTQTMGEDLVVLLQSKTDGTLDTGWTTIATATNATSMTSLTTAIPVGTFVRLRITSKATIQPSFSVQVNGTVTA